MNQKILTNTTGLLVLLFPPMLMAVPGGGSVTLILLALISSRGLFLNRNPLPLDKNEKLLLATVAVYMLIYLFNVWLFSSKLSKIDNTLRFLFLLPIFFYIRKIKLNTDYLYYGILAGAVASFAIAAYQKFFLGLDRADGVAYVVSFGGFSITLAMMCFVIGLLGKTWQSKILFYSGFILAGGASILSGSRGAWLALLPCLLMLSLVNPKKWSLKVRITIPLITLLMISASYFLPIVQHRVDIGIKDVNDYFTHNVANTSLGSRLEIWRASLTAATDHLVLGIGEGNFKNKMKQLSDQNRVDPVALTTAAHVHNEYISALLHRGIPGLISLLLLFLIPLTAFSKALISEQGAQCHTDVTFTNQGLDRKVFPAIGVVLIISTMTLSLSDVFFNQHKYTLFYATFIYLIYAFLKNQSQS